MAKQRLVTYHWPRLRCPVCGAFPLRDNGGGGYKSCPVVTCGTTFKLEYDDESMQVTWSDPATPGVYKPAPPTPLYEPPDKEIDTPEWRADVERRIKEAREKKMAK